MLNELTFNYRVFSRKALAELSHPQTEGKNLIKKTNSLLKSFVFEVKAEEAKKKEIFHSFKEYNRQMFSEKMTS